MKQTPTRANRTVAISNSASPEIIWGLGSGPEEDFITAAGLVV